MSDDMKKHINYDYVWRGRRYWTMEPKEGEHIGWNTWFEPYKVIKVTAKRIVASLVFIDETVYLDRAKIESRGKFYHSKFGEYFYLEKPERDPEQVLTLGILQKDSALSVLQLSRPCTKEDVKSAYKRLARQRHPDFGGSHEAFIKLNAAYESAMKIL